MSNLLWYDGQKQCVFEKGQAEKKTHAKCHLVKLPFFDFLTMFKLKNRSCPSKGTLQKPGEDTQDIDVSDAISTSIVSDPLVYFRNVNLSLFCQGSSNYPRIGGDQTMQLYAHFEGFLRVGVISCDSDNA